MNFIIAIIISFLIFIGVYSKAPKLKTNLFINAFAQPIITAVKWVDSTTTEEKLRKFSDIQKTMGGAYETETGTLEYLQKRMRLNPERDWHFELYEDADYQITLGFMYNETRDRVKVVYGGIGRCKNYKVGQQIAWKFIRKYLQDKGKDGYLIYDSTGLHSKAIGWYRQIEYGIKHSGMPVRKEVNGSTVILEFEA